MSEFGDIMRGHLARRVLDLYLKALKPFEAEIDKHGGSVSFEVSKDMKSVSMTSSGLSQELRERIVKAMPIISDSKP